MYTGWAMEGYFRTRLEAIGGILTPLDGVR